MKSILVLALLSVVIISGMGYAYAEAWDGEMIFDTDVSSPIIEDLV